MPSGDSALTRSCHEARSARSSSRDRILFVGDPSLGVMGHDEGQREVRGRHELPLEVVYNLFVVEMATPRLHQFSKVWGV